jgi:UDP:flavonoid glycosyltransferase YjiC (YdhE family)
LRVVVAAHPYVGHLRIPIQLATYLSREGHSVAILTGTGYEAVRGVVPWDLPTFAVDGGIDAAGFGAMPPGVVRGDVEAVASILAGGRPVELVADIVGVLERFRADVVVRDCHHFLAAVAAARVGVPEVSVILNPEATTNGARRAFRAVQEQAGVPDAGDVLSPVCNLSFLPAAFYEDEVPAVVQRRVELDPGSIRGEPGGTEVLVSFGTIARPVKAIVKLARALGEVGRPSVIAVGWLHEHFRDRPAIAPGNVRIVGFVDQTAVLPGCRLFVSHAGFNSVREAVTAGCPMLVAPQFGEQLYNAGRCVRLGLARELDLTATSHALATEVAAALDDPSLRTAAAEQQQATLAAPSAADIGSVLAEVVTAR